MNIRRYMKTLRKWWLPAFMLLPGITGIHAQETRRLSEAGISPPVIGVLEVPRTPGTHPGIIILHGSGGWRPAYARLAKTYADSGFVALAIDYFAETGGDTSGTKAHRLRPAWQATVRNAAAFLERLPEVGGRPLGLIGFSRGAFLAVSVASSIPAVGAVVDFFGGGGPDSLAQEVHRFPPLLILHGEADTVVPVYHALRLREAVLAQGGSVEMHLYPGAGHAFNAPSTPAYQQAAAADSFRRSISFLRRQLSRR